MNECRSTMGNSVLSVGVIMPDKQPIITIQSDGTVVFGEHINVDDLTKLPWWALQAMRAMVDLAIERKKV